MNCNCVRCISQCMKHPGIFAPGDIENAAALLSIGVREFVRAYVVFDFWTARTGRIWFPTPVKLIKPHHTHEGKAAFTHAFVPGRCIFLDENARCLIYSARPKECRDVNGCEPESAAGVARDIITEWARRQDRVERLMAAHTNERQLDL